MANIVQIKRSSVAGKQPNVSDLQVGELALNLADGIIYSKNTTGNVIVVGSSTTSNVREGSNLYFTNARVTTAVSTQTLTNATFSGNVTASYFIGDGSKLTGLAPAVQVFKFANVVSDISTYFVADQLDDFTSNTTHLITTTISQTPTLLGTFATRPQHPSLTVLPTGAAVITFETQKTSGNKAYNCYAELYKRTSANIETLLATTDVTSSSTLNSSIQQRGYYSFLSPITLDVNDRIVIRVYGQLLVSGTDDLQLRIDDNTNSGFELPTLPASINAFIPYTNAQANIDVRPYNITANQFTGNFAGNGTLITGLTTSIVTEGSNLYFSNARVAANVATLGYATTSYVSNAIANLVASAPSTLDTLNELATALGNDNNFASSILTIVGNKANVNVVTAAFNQANTSFTQANVAFAQANVAFNQANVAFSSGNTNYGLAAGYANVAFAQANIAFAQANIAFSSGNTNYGLAAGYANVAFAQANVAFNQANVAFSSGNTNYGLAASYANVAFNQANVAFAQANTAFSSGNTNYGLAASYANVAFAQANVAFNQANTAFAQANTAFNSANVRFLTKANVADLTTANVAELTNLYFSNARVYANLVTGNFVTSSYVTSYVAGEISNLVASAPSTLDTLNELAAALGNDSNFSTSILSIVGNKANTSLVGVVFDQANSASTQASTASGQATAAFAQANVAFAQANVAFNSANVRFLSKANVADLTTANVAEVTNLYFTNVRAQAAVANTNIIFANLTTTGNLTVGSGVGGNITGVNNLYTTNLYSNVVIANVWSGIYTANVVESTNLYFTNARAVNAFTQGYGISIAANGRLTVTATSSSYSDANTYANVSLLNYATNSRIDGLTTSDIPEGSRPYYSESLFNSSFAGKSTSDLSEGSNPYFSNERAISAFTAGSGITISPTGTIASTGGTSGNYLIDYGFVYESVSSQQDFGSIM